LANLAEQRFNLIRTLANDYNEKDETTRLERLARIQPAMKIIKKAKKEPDNERLLRQDQKSDEEDD
jgi:hypothetical protein